MKAWRVVCKKLPDESGIYIAGSRGRAIAKAFRQLHDVGYKAEWTDFRCERAKEYDAWARRQGAYRREVGISEEYAWRELEALKAAGK